MRVITVHSNDVKSRNIGDAVAAAMDKLGKDDTVALVVPRMVSFFATAPERYEVTEVALILNDE